MSSEQIAGESVKVIGYAADGLYSNVCNMVGGVFSMIGKIGDAVFGH